MKDWNKVNEKLLHPWDVDIKEAKKIQERLRKSIIEAPFNYSHFLAAGIDVSYRRGDDECIAAIVVISYPQFEIKEVSISKKKFPFPYVPGYLSFREGPAILDAWEKLKTEPDLLLFDGQGMAHPRRMGEACHIGLLLDKPSIGCAKSHLYGNYVEPGNQRGAFSYVTDPKDGAKLGAVLRTRPNVACVYVSPGHRMDVSSAIKNIFSLTLRYRIPEPLRHAHAYSKKGL